MTKNRKGKCPNCGSICDIIFRWSYRHHETGKEIRASKRPFPIPVCSCVSRKRKS